MSDLIDIAGIGGSFEALGKTWTWAPLTIGQMAELEQSLRTMLGERLDMIGPTLRLMDKHKVRAEDRKACLEACMREQMRIEQASALALADVYGNQDVAAEIVRFHLLKHHPDITIETMRGMQGNEIYLRCWQMIMARMRATLPGKDARPRSAGDSASKSSGRARSKKKTGSSIPTGS